MSFARMKKCVLAFAALNFVACSQGTQFGLSSTGVNFAQAATYNNKVDMILIMDNSTGMENIPVAGQGHLSDVATAAPSFVNALMAQGLDLHVAVITTTMGGSNPTGGVFLNGYVTNATPNLAGNLVGQISAIQANGSDLARGLDSLVQVLSPNYLSGPGAGFLRSDALLAVVTFSDQDDHSVSLGGTEAAYSGFLDQLKGTFADGSRKWTMNYIGILSLQGTCVSTGGPVAGYKEPGVRWMDLSTLSGGIQDTICSTNLAPEVANIHSRIVQILSDYYLGTQTPNLSTVVVKVNGTLIPQDPTNGWQYLAATNSIRFYGTSIPSATDSISITFTPSGAN